MKLVQNLKSMNIIYKCYFFIAFLTSSALQAQVGIGTASPHDSSILEIASANKALLLPRVDKADVLPATEGMLIYDTILKCVIGFENGVWSACYGAPAVAGIFTINSCTTASAGTLTTAQTVAGVSQTINVDVTVVGAFSFTAVANAVTFSASGNFSTSGSQDVVLTATGIPAAAGTFSYALSGTPTCSFSRVTN